MPDEYHIDTALVCCFWCGESIGVAIDKRLKKGPNDLGPAKRVFAGYDPCDKCQEMFDKGIQVVGVTPDPILPDQDPMGYDGNTPMYPNGTWFLATEEWATRFLADDQKALDSCLQARKLLVPAELVEKVVGRIQQEEAQANESSPSGVQPDSGEVPNEED